MVKKRRSQKKGVVRQYSMNGSLVMPLKYCDVSLRKVTKPQKKTNFLVLFIKQRVLVIRGTL